MDNALMKTVALFILELSARNRPATDSFPLLILQIQLYIVTTIATIAKIMADIGTNCHKCVAATKQYDQHKI